MDEICTAVGVSQRTFFNYFDVKDEAFLGVDTEQTAAIVAAIAARPVGESPLGAVAAVLAEVIGDTAGSSIWHEQLLLLREHPVLIARVQATSQAMEQAIGRAVAERTGLASTEPYVGTVAAAAMTALRVALGLWLDSPEGSDPRQLLDTVVGYLHEGLAVPAD